MKRFLLVVILASELVIGGVLYFSYAEVLGRPLDLFLKQNQPAEEAIVQAPELASEEVASAQLVAQPQAASQVQAVPQINNEPVASNVPVTTNQAPILTDAVLQYFDTLPNEATPETYQLSDALTDLGRMLYYDPRLSASGEMSCNTCHLLDVYGVDHLSLSLGHTGLPLKRNSPTVYNAALHVEQFWDGRSPTVESQAKEPILSSAEMGMPDPATVEAVIRGISGYQPLFAAAFPGESNPIRFDNIGTAIGAFERKLITPSRFDQFLGGEWNQLTPGEIRGFVAFVQVGCTDCHQGVVVGGQLYKKLGLVEPYETADQGRYEITRAEIDRYVFKVPSLRNIAETAPYLHDGSIQTLPEMVALMGRHQLGKTLEEQQINDIVTFLQSLTGEIPFSYIQEPLLPQ